MAHAAHLSTPEELEADYDMITCNGAKGMGIERYGIAEGMSADLLVLDAPSVHEALRLQAPRAYVIKRGRVVATTGISRRLSR